jgi:endoglucanase
MRRLTGIGWAVILACGCVPGAPVMAGSQDPGTVASASADDTQNPAPPPTPDEQVAALLSLLVDSQTGEMGLRATSEAMRKESLILEVVADQLEDVADYLGETSEAIESAIDVVSAYRQPEPAFGEPVSDARFGRMTRGVNFSHWFSQSQTGRYERSRLEAAFTMKDFRLIRGMGFRHVRFPLDDRVLFDPDSPGVLNPELLDLFDRKLDQMLEAGLAVIVVIQPDDEFKNNLLDPQFAEKVITFWHALASHLSGRDPDRVFLEVLNEPTPILPTPKWRPLQWKLLKAMRAGAPDHTLIASGGNYSGPEDLLKLEPYPDRNIVYNFHYYRPFAFTHQGAVWGKPTWSGMSQIPWPMNTEKVQAALSLSDDRDVRKDIVGTTWTKGSQAFLRADLARVGDWAKKYAVRVTTNEMGVYTLKTDRESRLRWHRVVTSTLDELGIGWAIWDYTGGFDVVKTVNGERVPDPQMLEALGLSKTDQPMEVVE